MIRLPVPKFKQIKPLTTRYSSFAKGLNTLISPTKIRPDELQRAENIILVDEGSPQRRWGTSTYGNALSGNGLTGIYGYYKSDNTSELLVIDNGFLKKYNTNSFGWDVVSGASFASGIRTDGVIAYDSLYLSNGVDQLAKYNGTGLTVFSSISAPASIWTALGGSFASGQNTYSYRVSARNSVGETLATAATTRAVNTIRSTWNPDPTVLTPGRTVTINWSPVVGATGYNIYGVVNGSETFLQSVDGQGVTSWIDYGTQEPSPVFTVPQGDTSSGPKGKYITEFKGALVIAGDPENPSRVYFSAGGDKIDSFSIADGGGWVDVSKNSDDGAVTGLATFQNKTIITKERSIWQLDFTESVIPSLSNISKSIGCVSGYTILPVENDLFFLGRKPGGGAAIYVLGNEPNYLNVIRTNELSARIRPDLLALSSTNLDKAAAVYFDAKYILFFTDGGANYNNAAFVYDRERMGFTKWEQIYVSDILTYYDNDKEEYLLYTDPNDNRVSRISDTYTTDKGTAIAWAYKTKEEDFKTPFNYKNFQWLKFRLRNVSGTVTMNVTADDNTVIYNPSVSTNTVTSAFGHLNFGRGKFGETLSGGEGESANIITRRIPFHRKGRTAIAKSLALEITGNTASSRATLLDFEIEATPRKDTYFDTSEIISS